MPTPKDSFEKIAARYAHLVDAKPIHQYYERPNLWSLLPSSLENLKILDLGCGTGWYAEKLIQSGAEVTAIDASPTLVEFTKMKLQGRGKVFQADLEGSLDCLLKNEFDIILAPLVIHYVKNWHHLFKKLNRLLKIQGLFIFSTHQPQQESLLFKLDSYFKKTLIKDYWKDVGEVTFYHHTLHELFAALRGNGFTLDEFLEPMPLPAMKDLDPVFYETLTKNPWFLFIKAIKSMEVSK